MSRKVKNEFGHYYGDFQIIAEYPERAKINGCVQCVCKCTICGTTKIMRGTSLRYGEIKGICLACKYRKR